MKPIMLATLFLGTGILAGIFINVSAEESLIPSWIKNTAKFWINDQVSDKEFLSALQYLVKQGILVIPNDGDEANSMAEAAQNKQVRSTSLSDLLPTREDIGTEWRIQEFETDKKLESATEQMARRYSSGSPTDTIITLYLYRFDSKETASSVYDSKIKEIYEKGGFKEYNVGLVGAEKCYGSLRSYDAGDKGEVYCYKNNIYFIVDFRTIMSYIEEEPKSFTSTVTSKMGS